MKKAVKVLAALAGLAGVGAAGIMVAKAVKEKADKGSPVIDTDEEDPDEDDYMGEIDDLFEDLDDGVCPNDTDMKAQCPIFGDEKRLLPGEKKFLDEFLDSIQALTTIMNDEIASIDLLTRTSNMPCKIKCDKIKDICREFRGNCDLVAGITGDVLKVLRKEHCDEYLDFLNAGIEKMKQEGMNNE